MQELSNTVAVILAGGRGTRLRPVLPDRPKVMAQINNRPFITYLLDQLDTAGFNEVVISTGYMADDIQNELGMGYKSLRIQYSREMRPLGTGGALRLALPLIKSDPVVVMNGDSFTATNLSKYFRWFFQVERKVSLLLTHVSNSSRFGNVVIDDNCEVERFEEKRETKKPGLINAGIYIIRKSLISTIPYMKINSLENEFFPSLIGKGLFGYLSKGRFIDIGTPESYSRAEAFFNENRRERAI